MGVKIGKAVVAEVLVAVAVVVFVDERVVDLSFLRGTACCKAESDCKEFCKEFLFGTESQEVEEVVEEVVEEEMLPRVFGV